jgi:hypothetical protein
MRDRESFNLYKIKKKKNGKKNSGIVMLVWKRAFFIKNSNFAKLCIFKIKNEALVSGILLTSGDRKITRNMLNIFVCLSQNFINKIKSYQSFKLGLFQKLKIDFQLPWTPLPKKIFAPTFFSCKFIYYVKKSKNSDTTNVYD